MTSRAAQSCLAGHMRPTGRRLESPALYVLLHLIPCFKAVPESMQLPFHNLPKTNQSGQTAGFGKVAKSGKNFHFWKCLIP